MTCVFKGLCTFSMHRAGGEAKIVKFVLCRKAAASDHKGCHPVRPSGLLGVQAVCALGQFPGIRMPLPSGRTTSVKSTFDH